MKTVYESKFKVVLADEEHQLLYKIWSVETKVMTDEEFKYEMTQYGILVAKYKPTKELVSMVDFDFTIKVELQNWVSNTIFAIYDLIGLKYAAFVNSPELIPQLSLEQAMEEGDGAKLQKRYFNSEQEAFDWILNI